MTVQPPSDVVPVLGEVVVRLDRSGERLRWNTLIDPQHSVGLTQFVERGVRDVAEWQGRWLVLQDWQRGVVPCCPRDA